MPSVIVLGAFYFITLLADQLFVYMGDCTIVVAVLTDQLFVYMGDCTIVVAVLTDKLFFIWVTAAARNVMKCTTTTKRSHHSHS